MYGRTRGQAATIAQRLVAEWETPSDDPRQPIIMTEGGGRQPIHVYVVWDNWEPLDQIERSEVVMEAFEKVHGTKKALDVTVAMGLTKTEAQRLGIAYE